MSKWETAKWIEVVEIKNGRNQKAVENSNGQYPIYGSGGVMGYANDYICDEDNVIIGRKGNINKPIYVNEKFWNVDTAFGLCANKKLLLPKYLYYFCVYFNFEKLNTTVTIPSLTKSNLLNIEIPLPPIETQKQIARTLDTIAELLAMRKQQLGELDNLTKSIFYNMFGDPLINEKRWEVKSLNDICTKITDGTHDTPIRVANGIMFITGKNIRPFSIDLNDIEYVSPFDHEIIYKRCNPQKGDILYTNIEVNYGTAAKCTLDFEFSMKNVALLKIDREVTESIYLECILNYERDYIVNQNQTGGAQTFMGLATIKNIKIMFPPILLQTQFAEIVTKIEEQKALVQKAIDETQYLFDSFMSYYYD